MRKRIFSVFLILLAILILWLTRARWIAALLPLLPPIDDPPALIDTIENLLSIFTMILVGLLFPYLAWLVRIEIQPQPPSPLLLTTLETLKNSATLGGFVQWVDRGLTNPTLLQTHPLLLIIGERKIGKTREAYELIQRSAGLLFPADRIFRLSPLQLTSLNKLELKASLSPFDPSSAFLLNLEDFHRHFTTQQQLDCLAEALSVFSDCHLTLYFVATARKNLLTPEQTAFLDHPNHRFHQVELPPLDPSRIGQLVDYHTAGSGIPIDADARQFIIDQSDGVPDFTKEWLNRLRADRITLPLAQEHYRPALDNYYALLRQELINQYPAASYLLSALADFYAVNVSPYTYLIVHYTISKMPSRGWWDVPLVRQFAIRRLLRQLTTYQGKYFKLENQTIGVKENIIENQSDPSIAVSQIENFLFRHRFPFHHPLFRFLYPNSFIHAWALFGLSAHYIKEENYQKILPILNKFTRLVPKNALIWNLHGAILSILCEYRPAIDSFDKALTIDPQDAKSWYFRGNALRTLTMYQQAVESYDRALAIDPQDAKAWYFHGLTLDYLGKHHMAIESFDRALFIDPQYAAAWSFRGNALSDLDEHQQAVESFDRALAIDSKLIRVWFDRGVALLALGEHQQAVDSFDRALAIDPQYAKVWAIREVVLYTLSQYQTAMESYDQVLDINLQGAKFRYSRGITLHDLNGYQAMESYDRSLDTNPQGAKAWYTRGLPLYDLGKYQQAIESCNRALASDPQYAPAWSLRGLAHAALGQHLLVVESCDHALEIDPEDANVWSNRGDALCNLGKYQQALDSCDRALAINPNLTQAWSNRGVTLLKLGEYQQALESFERALDINSKLALTWYNRGVTLLKLGEYQQALKSFERALDIDPQHAAAWYNRGVALSVLGQHQLAVQCYDHALDIDPDLAQAWSNRGASRADLQDYTAALSDFAKAIDLKPDFPEPYYGTACVYSFLNDPDQACHWLSQAIAMDPESKQLATIDSKFDPIRSDPNFQKLLQP